MALHETEAVDRFAIPPSLQQKPESPLPNLAHETLCELSAAGWKRVGIMVAILDSAGDVLMLSHHARRKNYQDMLGPLGETSQHNGPLIEQPIQTLYRGIREELMVFRPENLALRIPARGGWLINNWPRGTAHPGEFSCAISFPVFITDEAKEQIAQSPHHGKEICGGTFMSPDEILATDDGMLRPGVVDWVTQLAEGNLLSATGHEMVPVPFASVSPTPQPSHDIDLAQWSETS